MKTKNDSILPETFGGSHTIRRRGFDDVTAANYGGSNRHIDIELTAAGLNDVLREFLVRSNKISRGIFAEKFTIDGLPVSSAHEVESTLACLRQPEAFRDFLKITSIEETGLDDQAVHVLYRKFIKMNPDGSLGRFGDDVISLRGPVYFSADPATRAAVRERNSIAVGISADVDTARLALSTTNGIELKHTADTNKLDRNVIASPLDHMRNIGLIYLNAALLLTQSSGNSDTLTSNVDIPTRQGKLDDEYCTIVKQWQTESAELQGLRDFVGASQDALYAAIGSLVERYHLFLLDGDIGRLEIDPSQFEVVMQLVGIISSASTDFEEMVARAYNNQKTQERLKRELFKRIFRHERDADHPGINLLFMSQFIDDDNYSNGDKLVLGTAYGGIEYPFIYDALRAPDSDTPSLGENRGFIFLSNYNLGYRPSTSGIASKHIYPADLVDTADADSITDVLVLDDNAVTGVTRLQVQEFLRIAYPKARVTVACADVNTQPHDVERSEILRTSLRGIGYTAVRTFLNRPHGSPRILHASRYFMPHKPRYKKT